MYAIRSYYGKDGSWVWVETTAMPHHNEEGKFVGIHGVTRDITDRKKIEALIKHQNEQLKNANHEKDRFVSILAHDLRSPFSAMLGVITSYSIHYTKLYEFTNEERAIVGTIYKQTSKEAAILKGLEIVGPKMADFAKQALSLATNNHLFRITSYNVCYTKLLRIKLLKLHAVWSIFSVFYGNISASTWHSAFFMLCAFKNHLYSITFTFLSHFLLLSS